MPSMNSQANLDALLEQAAADLDAGRIEQANQSVQRALILDPQSAAALNFAAAVAMRMGDGQAAVQLFRRAIAINTGPAAGMSWYNLGVTLGSLGQVHDAIEAY